MKKVIIVSCHFPPSNLTAAHRARLFALHLPSLGWEPIIITVDYRYYEEKLDWDLVKLLPEGLRIESVAALPTKPVRLVGDIGIRSFLPMLWKILAIIRKEKIDFLYITIPSNYLALLGRIVYLFTRTKYGIDYIDPWVVDFSADDKKFSKAWFSKWIAKIIEPVAVRDAALITGVAVSYYEDVFIRNPNLKNSCQTTAMPFGGEREDNQAIAKFNLKPYLFAKTNKIDLVYAGAMLPKAHKVLRAVFEAMVCKMELYENIRIHFIGTGKTIDNRCSFNIKPLAEEFGLWEKIIFEYPERISYLDVLMHLRQAEGIFILGSTESHYTPSKVYQALLSEKPILAILHQESTACQVIDSSRMGLVLRFHGEEGLDAIKNNFNELFRDFLGFMKSFSSRNADRDVIEQYSAHNVTEILASALERSIRQQK